MRRKAIPPIALITTTTNGGARQTVRRTKPTSATPKLRAVEQKYESKIHVQLLVTMEQR
jgi:hypothetical protein